MTSNDGPTLIDRATGFSLYVQNALDARFLYKEIFQSQAYRELRLGANPVVLDVGANIGIFSLFIKRLRPRAQVLAFEPVPALVSLMTRNLDLHRITGVTLFQAAVGAQESEQSMIFYPTAPSNSTLYPETLNNHKMRMSAVFSQRLLDRMYRGRSVVVPVRPLSSFLKADAAVDLLKIDVVGSELDVLTGIHSDQWRTIRRILVDLQDQNGRLEAVSTFLEKNGFVAVTYPAPLAAGDGLNFVIDAIGP